MLIDTHCHLDELGDNDLEELMVSLSHNNVSKVIVSGYDAKSSYKAIDISKRYDNVYVTVGFHPHECMNIKEEDYMIFEEWLKEEKVIGIGEIGLDYYYDVDYKEKQIELFEKQIEIAIKYNKPIVIHNRYASNDIYQILKDKKVRGIIHCFNDDLEIAHKFIDLNFFLGIGGIITFKNSKTKNVIKNIPIKYIVLETDSPYLSPEPYRGRKNSPNNLKLIAKSIAEIKKISYDEVAINTTSNVRRLFDIM